MKYIGFQVAGLPGNDQLGYKCSISIKNVDPHKLSGEFSLINFLKDRTA